jgi:hypothetical protein
MSYQVLGWQARSGKTWDVAIFPEYMSKVAAILAICYDGCEVREG